MTEAAQVAKDYRIGNTRIKIATDYCDQRTPEEVQDILDRIARMALETIRAAESIKSYV